MSPAPNANVFLTSWSKMDCASTFVVTEEWSMRSAMMETLWMETVVLLSARLNSSILVLKTSCLLSPTASIMEIFPSNWSALKGISLTMLEFSTFPSVRGSTKCPNTKLPLCSSSIALTRSIKSKVGVISMATCCWS